MSAGIGPGIALVTIGLIVVLLVWLALYLLPKTRSTSVASQGKLSDVSSLIFPGAEQSVDAVLIIQPGGRVEYINALARQSFDLSADENANLERLTRRVRPADDFLDVCAVPGQKRLTVNGRLMEATSYQVPGTYPLMLVSLRDMNLGPALSMEGVEASGSILKIVTDFSQSIAANLDFETTIQAILDNVSRLVPADVLELKILDAATQKLIPYQLQETGASSTDVMRLPSSQFGSYTDRLLEERRPIQSNEPPAAVNGSSSSVQSYLGVPLIAGGELVGTLEAGQSSAAFGQHDLDLMQLISGQAAVAIRNASLYEEEQRRVAELAGLANLNQAVSAIRDPHDLFTRLVESIAPLFKAEIVGFLLFDEARRVLEGQVPFRGLPAQIVQIYRSVIAPESPAERVLNNLQSIVTMDASRDEQWRLLGLTDVAVAASLRDSALAPLVSAGRVLGYLQVSHHHGGTASFSADELRLMNIVANQAATIIENALLVQQSRERSLRSDSLRRIAALSASAATVDEILKYSVQELARLFEAEVCAVFLLDQDRGELHLHHGSAFGIPENAVSSLTRLSVNEPDFINTVSRTQRPLFSGRLSTDPRATAAYRPLVTALQMESAIIVPLLARDRSVGELMLASRPAEHFNSYDVQVVTTAAGQLASAIESASLMLQTDESLRQRVDQLSAVARISRELSGSLDLKHLLQVIHDEGLQAIRADCASIQLIGAAGKDLQVTLAVGCVEKPALSALDRKAIQSGKSLIITDFSQQGEIPPHDGIRSALLTPIPLQGDVVGLINLHSGRPDFFDAYALSLVETLAAQAATAINNARQYQDEKQRAELLRRRADTLDRIKDVSYGLYLEQPVEQSLQAIAQGIRDSTPFRVVLVSVYEPETGLLRRVAGVGLQQEALNELLARKQPLASLQQLMKPEFKISRSYYVPADQTPILPADVHYIYASHDAAASIPKQEAWQADDFFLIPLEDPRGSPLGLINLDDPANGRRPDRATVDALEVFAAQASLIITNSLRFSEMQVQVTSLSDGVQRQQKLLSVSQNDLPLLLHKDLEQTISLHNLERRAQRVRAGLAITESVSRQLDSTSALMALGRETLTQLGMSAALVAEDAVDGPRLTHVLGSIPRATNVDALFGQRNPIRGVLQTGEMLLIPNLDESDEWRDTPLLTSLRAKSAICLPVKVENKAVAAMLAVSPEPMTSFTEEDRQVYHQISRQTSVILQNISLLNETRRRLQEVDLLLDFSRRLSGLSPDDMVKALLESARRALPSAHAGVVFLWNDQAQELHPRAVSGYADNPSLMRLTYRSGEALPGIVFASHKPRRVDEINFPRDYSLNAENLLLYRQATGGRLPVSSLMVPVTAGMEGLGLLVLDNFNTVSAFRPEDEALLLSLAQQVALSLENVRLVHATQERAGQLQALNNAAASLTSSLRSDELVKSLLDQLTPVLPYDTATLWLRDKDRIRVAAASGFPDTEKRLGLTISVSDSALFNEMARTGQAMSVGDVRQDPRFPPVGAPRLSWLGIPLLSKGELAGVLALEKWQAHFFTPDYIQVATTFASQAIVSLENARLYEESLNRAVELDQRSRRLALLNRFSSSLSGLLDADQILQLTADELLQALSVKRISAVALERGRPVWKISTPASKRKLPQPLPDAPIFERLRESLGVFNTSDVRKEDDLKPLAGFLEDETRALLILPLISGSELRVLVFVHMTGDGHFGPNEIELARTITNQAAIALENARLYQSTLQTAERFSILNESSAQISANLDPEQVYAAVHRAAERVMPAESFVITLWDESTDEIEGVYLVDKGRRLASTRVAKSESLSGKIIDTGQPVLTHVREESTEAGGYQYGASEDPMSILAVPMTLGGRAIGMLSAQSYEPNMYTEQDLQILGTLANQAIVAIQNGRLFAETQRLAQELEQRVIERTAQLQREQQNTETLLRILTEVSSSLDLDRALNRTLSLLNDATGAEQGTIMLLNSEDNLLHYRAGYGYLSARPDGNERGLKLKVGEGVAGWVVENRESVLIEDLHADARWVQSPDAGQDHRSSIVTPLLVGEDVIGVLMIFHRQVSFFSPDILNLVKAIAGQVAVAINNAHLYELIRDQAERLGVMLRKEQEDASRSQAILEAVADGVLVTGPNNGISFLNSSSQRILGLDKNRLIGQPLDVFGGLFGKSSSEWMDTIRRWSEEPALYELGDTYAEQLELENGHVVLIHLAPVILQRDFLGTVSIFRDITHEVEVDRLKSEFVATVSHELRTPMTSIKGYVDILLMGAAGAFNENQAHFLEIIKNNAERLNILVNDLLDISRIEAGQVTLNPQLLDLREMAGDVIAELRRRSEEEKKAMEFSLSASRSLPPVMGDPERVRQIIANLVDNAYHYTPENGKVKVHIHALNGTEVQVDVKDTGVGIAQEDQERIFERFYRGENPLVLATPGTGLGLAIVRQLVEMHNGRIWMTSKGTPGEGSTFSFTLPIQK